MQQPKHPKQHHIEKTTGSRDVFKRTMYETLCDEATAKVDVFYLLRRNVFSLGQLKDILLPAASQYAVQLRKEDALVQATSDLN
jgi:hypothetical protein